MRIPAHKLKVGDILMTGEIVQSIGNVYRVKKYESRKIVVFLRNPLTNKGRSATWNKQGTVFLKDLPN